ncbi:MAG: PepSY-associated TM helix domain-containing protein [Hyphomonadaceae bacterium]|nr:PepSY-associated TM helix domain-containing protein [Hyphomonadaceae bacterium]
MVERAARAGSADPGPRVGARRSLKAFWLRQMLAWHWISAALSLVGMLGFAITGVTLNHAGAIETDPVVVTRTLPVPAAVQAVVARGPDGASRAALPAEVSAWTQAAFGVSTAGMVAEWSADDVYVALPRPGGDATLVIDRAAGVATHEDTDRGWVAYFNDLHKGRHAGAAWSFFIDAFAVACVVFCATGLALLWLKAVARPVTWPLVAAGLLAPAALALFFIH